LAAARRRGGAVVVDLPRRIDEGVAEILAQLDTKDQAKFAEGLKGIATQLGKLSQSGSDALKQLEEGDVGKAMAQQESCKSASASGSAGAANG
ncbi:hypothetical protein AB0M09_35810, partial [Streptomyces sp. NPDC051997]